jgi:hypothetical protein
VALGHVLGYYQTRLPALKKKKEGGEVFSPPLFFILYR